MTRHDPGGRSRFPLELGVLGSAIFHDADDCRRLSLQRYRGGVANVHAPYALWIGMNPSTAGEDWDDPTCRREWIYTTERLGLDRYVKVNIGDYCLTDSKALDRLEVPLSTDRNRSAIAIAAHGAKKIILAHGNLPKGLISERERIYAILKQIPGKRFWCLGTNKDGSPKHPLYVSGYTELEEFAL